MGPATFEDERPFWHQAYREHAPSILAFLTSRVGRREVAEEFLQETFLRAMRRGVQVGEGSNLRAYLFTTAHNLVVSDWRRRRPRLFSELSEAEAGAVADEAGPEAPAPETVLDLSSVRDRLDAALATLPLPLRIAFESAVLQQKPYAEIAREQGWTLEQVKVNVHRARKKVITQLRDLLGPGGRSRT